MRSLKSLQESIYWQEVILTQSKDQAQIKRAKQAIERLKGEVLWSWQSPHHQTKKQTDTLIDDLAFEALNIAARHIQDALGITTGDFAGVFFSDNITEENLKAYAAAELRNIEEDAQDENR